MADDLLRIPLPTTWALGLFNPEARALIDSGRETLIRECFAALLAIDNLKVLGSGDAPLRVAGTSSRATAEQNRALSRRRLIEALDNRWPDRDTYAVFSCDPELAEAFGEAGTSCPPLVSGLDKLFGAKACTPAEISSVVAAMRGDLMGLSFALSDAGLSELLPSESASLGPGRLTVDVTEIVALESARSGDSDAIVLATVRFSAAVSIELLDVQVGKPALLAASDTVVGSVDVAFVPHAFSQASTARWELVNRARLRGAGGGNVRLDPVGV